jgi:hypothetical protein
MSNRTVLTQTRLKELFSYCKGTGLFVRRITVHYRAKAGGTAGHTGSNGYVVIKIDGRAYKAHRLAFLYVTGLMPLKTVDHINWVKDDNRWDNLRTVSHRVNCRNRPMRKDNSTGVTGVFKVRGKWQANIGSKYLGFFSTKADATLARIQAVTESDFHLKHGLAVLGERP